MCMIDFGCYTNHSLGMNTASEYNDSLSDKGHVFTFVCDRYSIGSFPALDELSRGVYNHLRCGLEIDVLYENKLIPIKCIAVSDKGIENLYKIVGRADGNPIHTEALADIRDGVLIGCSGGYDSLTIRDFTDFWYLTPAFSNEECISIYEAAKISGKPLCAATNACYVNESDEQHYRILQEEEDLGSFKNPGKWNHMMSESEMFKRLDFLGHHAAQEILIDNPFKMLDPYWEYLSCTPFPVPLYGKEYNIPLSGAVAAVSDLAIGKFKVSKYKGDDTAQKRLSDELEHIKPFHAERLLLSWHLSKNIRDRGYRPINKGWVGSLFIAYLLGITNVDPIQHEIPWELYLAAPDPKSFSVRHCVPEAMKSARKELLESCLQDGFILPCRYECDIPFTAKAALGKVLGDKLYPFTAPEFTYALYESPDEFCVFPSNFDKDLAKGITTLSPRLLIGHIPIVELQADERIDVLKHMGANTQTTDFDNCILESTGKALSRYAEGVNMAQAPVFAEDIYKTLTAQSRITKSEAICIANNIRKGLYSSKRFREFSNRHMDLLIKAGFPEDFIENVLFKIQWLCPKSEAIEETMFSILTNRYSD